MKVFAGLALLFSLSVSMAFGQQEDRGKGHKIVFQFTNGKDTLQQKAFINQLNNLKEHWPEAEYYVVVYNMGLELVMPETSVNINAVQKLHEKGVQFVVCENTMKTRKITKEQFIPQVTYVKAGIAEIVLKQEAGYTYIKGGF
jgi:intracellular sulfur oxidation DsrE/DsrF family protein